MDLKDIKKLIYSRFFLTGLLIRILLVFFLFPIAVFDWYLPFLETTINNISFDPWQSWLDSGGDYESFPYGYSMWIFFAPFIAFFKFVGFPLKYGYFLALFIADLIILFLLNEIIPKRTKFIVTTYWLSPIIILASYALGLNDLIPVLFLFSSIYFLKYNKVILAGFFMSCAISAKLSMIISLPFFLIYFYNNKSLRQLMFSFTKGLGLGFLIFILPFIFSISGLLMLFNNPEIDKIYNLSLDLNDEVSVYIVPIIYLVILYIVWRIKRLNFDLLIASICLSFLLIVLFTPASPGWFVWTIPFLVFYQSKHNHLTIFIVTVFSFLYVLSTLMFNTLYFTNGNEINLINQLSYYVPMIPVSLFNTVMVGLGAILSFRIFRDSIKRNNFFRLSRKPFVIGISGDSGSGKDTFVNCIEDLFGNHSVTKISGDDYHLWDRKKPMWQVMTHLNPVANDLEEFSSHLISLLDNKEIKYTRYNHKTGKMSKPLKSKSNDFIISSGLHALYLPVMRSCYDLKVFLNMNDNLRNYLKIKRDVNERGHSLENVLNFIKKRQVDSDKFIKSQQKYADIIFNVEPLRYIDLNQINFDLKIETKLNVTVKNSFFHRSMSRVLVGILGLNIELIENKDSHVFKIDGHVESEDISIATKILCPKILEFLDFEPEWKSGVLGLMQLFTITYINQELTKRIIK